MERCESICSKVLLFGGAGLSITQSGSQALAMSSEAAQMDVEVHLPTGIMDVDLQLLSGEQVSKVQLQHFLRFFNRYQVSRSLKSVLLLSSSFFFPLMKILLPVGGG